MELPQSPGLFDIPGVLGIPTELPFSLRYPPPVRSSVRLAGVWEHSRCAIVGRFFSADGSQSRPTMKAELIKRFEDDIAVLRRELNSELPKEIKRARELGDLRENAEYQAAKERQSFVQARLAMLHKRVSELSLMNLDRIPEDRTAFGSTVHLREIGGQPVVYRLVMPEDADPSKGWISTASPIGRALLGKEEGDEVEVPTPSGTREFELVKLVTIHGE